MAEETVNQEAAAPETSPAEDTATHPARTFTQAEVDAIIGDRLTRERAKYQDYEDLKQRAAAAEKTSAELQTQKAKAAELQAQLDALQKDIEARNARDKVSAETGVPANLLTGQTEEENRALADAIIKWRGPQQNYPTVPDGGTVNPFTGGTTRDQFESWAKANLNL
jgi:hypothetical protein